MTGKTHGEKFSNDNSDAFLDLEIDEPQTGEDEGV
jgi:hypothetical protein